MSLSRYRNSRSFYGKTQLVLCLLGLIPLLMYFAFFMRTQGHLTETVLLILGTGLISILLGYVLMRRSADQLGTLSQKTRALAGGESHEPVAALGDRELDDIAGHFNTLNDKFHGVNRDFKDLTVKLMVYAKDIDTYQKKMQEEMKLRNMLGRYVGDNVVEQLLRSEAGMPLKNEKREVTILFADIRSFTTISEAMNPEEVVTMLNEYFGAMVKVIFKHNGVLDKFVGDEIMALFGLLPTDGKPAHDAVAAAAEMQEAVRTLMQSRKAKGQPVFDVGIGINTGDVIVGNVGAKNRMDYTVIGDAVNVASRLEQMAQGYDIIVGEETWRQCQDDFGMRKKGEIKVRNRAEPVACYEVSVQA